VCLDGCDILEGAGLLVQKGMTTMWAPLRTEGRKKMESGNVGDGKSNVNQAAGGRKGRIRVHSNGARSAEGPKDRLATVRLPVYPAQVTIGRA
jgi:hypothetical protein